MSRRSARALLSLLVGAQFACSGCSEAVGVPFAHTDAYRFGCSAVEPAGDDRGEEFRVVPGGSQVFELSHVAGQLPPPDNISGWSLYLVLNPDLVEAGRVLQVPGPGVACFLSEFRGPMSYVADDCRGELAISTVRDLELSARLAARSTSLDWSYEGEVVFRSAIRSRSSAGDAVANP